MKDKQKALSNEVAADMLSAFDLSGTRINVLVGINGSGKTTMLDKLADQLLNSHDVHMSFTYQLQHAEFLPSLNVEQTISLYRAMGAFDQRRFLEWGGQQIRSKITPLLKRKMGQLSGGEQKIVLTYCTCQLNRALYLFDEPLEGVDSVNIRLVLQMIEGLVNVEKRNVILTMHQIEMIKAFKNPRIVLLLPNGDMKTVTYSELCDYLQ